MHAFERVAGVRLAVRAPLFALGVCAVAIVAVGCGGGTSSSSSGDGGSAPHADAGDASAADAIANDAGDSGQGDAACTGPGCSLPAACDNLQCGGPCTLGTDCETPGDPCSVTCTAQADGGAIWICGGC